MPHLFPCLLLLGIVAVWGWTFSLMKGPVEAYGVVPFLAVRFAMATVALLAVGYRRLSLRTLKTGAGIGLVLTAAYLFQTFGLTRTTATNTGIITGLFVVFAPIANRLVFGVRTGPLLWAAIGVSLAGLLLLTVLGPTPLASGDALVLLCAVCYGLQIALLERHAKHHDAVCLALGQIGMPAVILLVLWPCLGPVRLPETTAIATKGEIWFALLVTALLASAAGAAIQTYVQQRLSAVQTAIIVAMEPVFAALFGYVCVGDRLAATQWVGAVLMVGAMVFSEVYPMWRRNRAGAA